MSKLKKISNKKSLRVVLSFFDIISDALVTNPDPETADSYKLSWDFGNSFSPDSETKSISFFLKVTLLKSRKPVGYRTYLISMIDEGTSQAKMYPCDRDFMFGDDAVGDTFSFQHHFPKEMIAEISEVMSQSSFYSYKEDMTKIGKILHTHKAISTLKEMFNTHS